jgi:hypothetical protein
MLRDLRAISEIQTQSPTLEGSHAIINTYIALVDHKVIETLFSACKADVIAIIRATQL